MKRPVIIVTILLGAYAAGDAVSAELNNLIRHYTNPLDVPLCADPFVLKHNGTYYLYGTSMRDGYRVWSSEDLVNWRSRGAALRRKEDSWGDKHYWAPEVVHKDGIFYMHYTVLRRGFGRRICVATSGSPLGPFKDVKTPMFDIGKHCIDGHVFEDDDGRMYFYYVLLDRGNRIFVARLEDDLLSLRGEHVFCLERSQPWERAPVNEGPFVVKHEGIYYLMYSGNGYAARDYGVGYATSDSPMGPWRKFEGNPVLKHNKYISGPGHHSVTTSPDGSEMFAAYHTHQTFKGGGRRQVAIDRMRFVERDGHVRLTIDGPTHSPQPWPSGAPFFKVGSWDEFDEPRLDRSRWVVFKEDARAWKLKAGGLVIETQNGDIRGERADMKNIFLQYAPPKNYTATTCVKFEPKRNHEQAFLCVWQDHRRYVLLSVAHHDGRVFNAVRQMRNAYTGKAVPNDMGRRVYLRIRRRGDDYTFLVSDDGKTWERVGDGYSVRLDEAKIGIGAASPGSRRRIAARFEFLHIEY